MKHIWLILSCFIAWTLRSAEDRIWVDVKINGQPVHMALDTGSSISMLLPKTVERLHLKLPNSKTAYNRATGMVNSPATEPCHIEYTNAGVSLTGRMQFGVFNFSSYVQTDLEGVLSWHVFRNNVFIFTNNVLNIRTNVPPQALPWPKFPMRTRTGILGFDVTGADTQHRSIFIDTGDFTGVALNRKLWEKWAAQHTNQLATLVAFEKVSGGIFIKKTLWANEIALGSLVLSNVTVRELDLKEEPPFGAPAPLAVLGLYALRRVDLVVDDLFGIVYARSRNSPPDVFEHNRLGAIFMPPSPDSDQYIAHVASGSPAEAAGIRDNDLLLRIDDYDLKNWRTDPQRKPLRSYWIRPPGTTYNFVLQRNGREFQTTVALQQILGPRSE